MAANPVVPDARSRLEAKSRLAETTVRAKGQIAAATSAGLERRVCGLIPGFRRVVLDVSKVDYIDDSGVGVLVNIYLQARKAGCDLEIANRRQGLKDRLRSWLFSVFEGQQRALYVLLALTG